MATAATGKTGNGASETPDLEADIKQLKADLEKLAKQMAATGGHGYGTARRAAAMGAEQLRAQGEAKLEELRASAEDIEEQILAAVREARHLARDRGGCRLPLRSARPTP